MKQKVNVIKEMPPQKPLCAKGFTGCLLKIPQ